jgi:hypothetical protein
VCIEVSGPRGYMFVKDLQVLSFMVGVNDRLRVRRVGNIINLFGRDLIR